MHARFYLASMLAALVALATVTGCSAQAPSAAAEPASPPTFDPAQQRCQGAPAAPAGQAWESSAPRTPASPASVVRLGLEGGAWNQDVTLTVTAPDGSRRAVTEPLAQSGRISIAYPIPPALPGPESKVPGSYTAVWTDAASGAFLACDGFVVAR